MPDAQDEAKAIRLLANPALHPHRPARIEHVQRRWRGEAA
jgi:hypothetical protein